MLRIAVSPRSAAGHVAGPSQGFFCPRFAVSSHLHASPQTHHTSRASLLKAQGISATSVWSAIPNQLLAHDIHERGDEHPAEPLTVYCVRLSTSYARGAAHSEPYSSGVNLLLVGQDGRAVLQRIAPVNDPAESLQQINTICQVVDESVGVNCSVLSALPPASSSSSSPPSSSSRGSSSSSSSFPCPPPSSLSASAPLAKPKLRFQEGQVDEVSFLAPELGPLVGVLVGTERGTWMLDELDVASSRTAHIDRFICREKVGAKTGEGAIWLVPVPPGAFVYGSGERTVILTKEQAASLRAMNLSDYDDLKSRTLLSGLLLTLGGTGVAGAVAGLDAALPFGMGGAAGMAYSYMLQLGVDKALGGAGGKADAATSMPAGGASDVSPAAAAVGAEEDDVRGMSDIVRGIAAHPAVRLGFVAAAALAAVSSLHGQGLVTQAVASCEGVQCMVGTSTQEGAWKLLYGLLGFLTYKVALVTASLAPAEDHTAVVAAGTATKLYESKPSEKN